MAQVVEQDPLISHTANGVTTLFAFPFQVLLLTDLVVQLDGVPTTTGFSVSGLGVQSGGSITFAVAPANGVEITIYRDTEIRRDTEYQSNGDFLSPVVNADFNRPLLILQEIASGGKAPVASVRAPRGEVLTQLPDAASRANKLLSFDSDGQPVALTPTSGDATDLAVLLAASDDATEGTGQIGHFPTGTGAIGRTARSKLEDKLAPEDKGAIADNSTDNNAAFINALGEARHLELAPGVYRVGTGNLTPTAKQRVTGAGRESTFIRTTHASNDVFSSTAQFVTYEHMSLDRTGSIAGRGINHVAVSNTAPLEGFVARHINANGHSIGIRLRDFVIATVEDCYLQSGTTGLDTEKTGANFCTILNVSRSWLRGNTDYGAYVAGVIGSFWEQTVFEGAGGVITSVGLYLSGGGRHQIVGGWWESLEQAAQFVDCGQVALIGGHWDGAQMTASQAYYAIGTTNPTTVVFDGAWELTNHSGTFATADQGATIIVRSPGLLGLTFTALNGGQVLFDCPLEGKATWNPASTNTLSKTASTTVTVTGAAVGDYAEAWFENGTNDPQNFIFKADVLSANTVTVSGFNFSSGAVDLASGTVSARVQKRALIS